MTPSELPYGSNRRDKCVKCFDRQPFLRAQPRNKPDATLRDVEEVNEGADPLQRPPIRVD